MSRCFATFPTAAESEQKTNNGMPAENVVADKHTSPSLQKGNPASPQSDSVGETTKVEVTNNGRDKQHSKFRKKETRA